MNENPYEKKDSVEVPSFVEPKEDVDMSVFKLKDETEETAEVNYEDDDDMEDSGRKLNFKVVIPLLVAVICLALAVAGIVFGFSQKGKLSEMKKSHDQYVATSEKKITELTTEINALKAEIEAMKTPVIDDPSSATGDPSAPATNGATKYTVTADTGLRVRKGAGTSNEAVGSVAKGTVVTVTETKNVDGGVWGKIREGEWICLSLNGEAYAKKN